MYMFKNFLAMLISTIFVFFVARWMGYSVDRWFFAVVLGTIATFVIAKLLGWLDEPKHTPYDDDEE